jgi:exodeoxyribonuclease VIII
MVDIETLSIDSNDIIIAIGAVQFDLKRKSIISTFYKIINPTEKDGVIDFDTIKWWMRQEDSVRSIFNAPGNSLKEVLLSLTDFFLFDYNQETIRVWGNGASFDNVILANAYKRCGLKKPWSYNGDMCYRTIKSLYPHVKIKREGDHHNALDDAISQTKHLIDIYESESKE